MSLTYAKIRGLQPRGSPYKIADQHGLYLLVNPSGAKLWKQRFRFRGIEKKLSLGRFLEVSLKAARSKCEDARRLLTDPIRPPQSERKRSKVQ